MTAGFASSRLRARSICRLTVRTGVATFRLAITRFMTFTQTFRITREESSTPRRHSSIYTLAGSVAKWLRQRIANPSSSVRLRPEPLQENPLKTSCFQGVFRSLVISAGIRVSSPVVTNSGIAICVIGHDLRNGLAASVVSWPLRSRLIPGSTMVPLSHFGCDVGGLLMRQPRLSAHVPQRSLWT